MKDKIAAIATSVERRPEAFEYVKRIALERALFALISDYASKQFNMVMSGFSDEVIKELEERSQQMPASNRLVDILKRILEKIQLISSGDPYITLEGGDVTLEGRGEVINSLGADLRALIEEVD
jgi:hypothetical protein